MLEQVVESWTGLLRQTPACEEPSVPAANYDSVSILGKQLGNGHVTCKCETGPVL